MHTLLIVLGVVLAIPVLLVLALFISLESASARGENPFR